MSSGERIIQKLKKQLGREPTAQELYDAAHGSGLLTDKEFERSVEQAKKEIAEDLKPGREMKSILRESNQHRDDFEKFMRDHARGKR